MDQSEACQKTRLLVVEDHAVARATMVQLLEVTDDFQVVGESGTASTAVELLKSSACDVVLLDVSLPDAPVVDTIRVFRELRPEAAILIVSMHPEEQYAADLMRAGVDGYFSKGQDGDELRKAIRTVANGHKYLSASLSATLPLAGTEEARLPLRDLLSRREYEVFLQLASGKNIADVADEMLIPIDTLKACRDRIFQKLNLSCNAELAEYAVGNRTQDAP